MRIATAKPIHCIYILMVCMALLFIPVMLHRGAYIRAILVALLIVISRGIALRLREIEGRMILYLRAFRSTSTNQRYSDDLEPILACFGRSFEISGYSPIRMDRATMIANWILRRQGRMGMLDLDNAHWREEVQDLIRKAFLVVVDLSTLTINVLYELNLAIEVLGNSKVVVLRRGRNVDPAYPLALDLSSPAFKHDTAALLSRCCGSPHGLKSAALTAAVKHGRSLGFYVYICLDLIFAALKSGLTKGLWKYEGVRLTKTSSGRRRRVRLARSVAKRQVVGADR